MRLSTSRHFTKIEQYRDVESLNYYRICLLYTSLPSTLRLRYDRAKGDFDYFTYCGKEVGKEIGDDALLDVYKRQLLDTGYMWELYAPDGTFLEKSLPVGERETLCQLCGDFCTFDVFLPLEENAFLAVGHHGKATEPDEPVVFRITTDF